MTSRLTLAVAGSGKTKGIVDACIDAPRDERILIITYTTANQEVLRSRIAGQVGDRADIDVIGWFSFLIQHFVRPFLPFLFPKRRVLGFDFKSPPRIKIPKRSEHKYFDRAGQVCRVHLAQLAFLVDEASGGLAIRRLTRLYDKIFIDEVQDLCGYDLEIMLLILDSTINLEMVGDVRQAVLVTNEREPLHRPYMYMGIWKWFRELEASGKITIKQNNVTWRCHPKIAKFADSLFGSEFGFEETFSKNNTRTGHDGVFLLRSEDVPAYVEKFRPLCLRYSIASGKHLALPFMNFRMSKGLNRERVLVYPTKEIEKFLKSGKRLEPRAATELYVAVTRAEQSVALVLDVPGESQLTYWVPET